MERRTEIRFVSFLVLAALFVFGSTAIGAEKEKEQTAPTKAVAVIQPTKGNNVKGTVTFIKDRKGVRVLAEIEGLSSGKHGFHIHEYGDCSAPDASSAGGHFNPHGAPHGGPTEEKHHVGDLGNIEGQGSDTARLDWIDPLLAFEGENSILGRAVVIHAQPDDFKTQPTGGAGPRAGCGVIGTAKP